MRKIFVWLGIIILLGGIAGAVNVSADTGTSGIETHSPISINGNQDFDLKAESENWTGNGSESNPYIIENYDINASSANGIDIRNTTAYFIIKNCTIHGNFSHHGIYLFNVSHATIDNIRLENDYYGIYLFNVSHATIDNIWLENDYYGTYLHNSSGNTITNCFFLNNEEGTHLFSSSNNEISNSYVFNNHVGIHLSSSDNNQITYCNITSNVNYGVFLSSSENNNITHCVYRENKYASIYLTSSSNNIIRDCNISKSVIGINIISSSNNNHIYNNTLDNAKNAWDECTNYWNSSSNGNYWSDYNGSGNYSIPGGENKDYYPSYYSSGPTENGVNGVVTEETTEKIPIIYPAIICVLVVIVCVILYGIIETKTILIRCPACGKTFRVKKKARPFRIECKYCGRKGVLK